MGEIFPRSIFLTHTQYQSSWLFYATQRLQDGARSTKSTAQGGSSSLPPVQPSLKRSATVAVPACPKQASSLPGNVGPSQNQNQRTCRLGFAGFRLLLLNSAYKPHGSPCHQSSDPNAGTGGILWKIELGSEAKALPELSIICPGTEDPGETGVRLL